MILKTSKLYLVYHCVFQSLKYSDILPHQQLGFGMKNLHIAFVIKINRSFCKTNLFRIFLVYNESWYISVKHKNLIQAVLSFFDYILSNIISTITNHTVEKMKQICAFRLLQLKLHFSIANNIDKLLMR